MYSVIRFSDFPNVDHLHAIGAEVNHLVPGLFTGPDRVGNRFSCTISEDDDWDKQCRSIEDMVSVLSSIIRKSAAVGVQIELDIAIDPEDYSGRLLTEFPLKESLLQAILETNIAFLFSLYGAGE